MSLLDDASLILVPSGYKEDKLYSVKPTDGTGDFTFSRASTATRVNSDGLIEDVPVNNILQSNTFDTTWIIGASALDLTSGQSGYDGSSNAWLLKKNTSGSRYLEQSITRPSGQYSYNVYIKAESTDWALLWASDGLTSLEAYFDVNNGVVGNTSGLDSTNVVNVGDGWFRCTITFTQSITSVRILPAYANGSVSTGADNGIYIQDAQLNKGTTAKPYFPTTDGLNVPRIDYSNGCGSLLLEPQRTNLITYSEDFSQWSNSRTTDTANQITSPDGLNNGTLLEQQSSQTNAGSIFKSVTLAAGTYAQSIFAKKKDKDFIVCYSANAERTYFNLSNGTIGTIASGNNAKIEDYGNGWYRCTISYTITSGSVIAFYLSDSDNSSVVTDSGGVYIFGAQLEEGSYPTSYIKTEGSAVTRVEEDIALTLPDDASFNSSAGFTLYGEFETNGGSGASSMALQVNCNLGYFGFGHNGSNWRARINNGTDNELHNSTTSILSTVKLALSFNSSGFSMYANGTSFASGNTNMSAITSADYIIYRDTDEFGSFRIRDFQLYNTALTDLQLESLTSFSSFLEMANALNYTII